MEIYPEIVDAINALIPETFPTIYVMGREIGIPEQPVYNVVAGRTYSLMDKYYDKLYPHIKRHLPDDPKFVSRMDLEHEWFMKSERFKQMQEAI